MVAQGSPWAPNGGTVVVTVTVQCTLLVGQRWHRGNIEGRQKRLSFAAERIYYVVTIGRLLSIHSATSAMPLCPFCLIWAIVQRPTCWATLLRLFWTYMAIVERPVYYFWTTKATMLPPLSLQWRPGQCYGRTKKAQRLQALCKGV